MSFMTDSPIAEKSVNALVPHAEARDHNSVMRVLKAFTGGLWVGGTATLYETRLVFRPNRLNRAVHTGDYTSEIPLREITDVRVRSGFVTNIIDIEGPQGTTLSVRCYGAEEFAGVIRREMSKS